MTSDDERRQRIFDAAAELFAENGYSGTKLQMVAARARVTARTVTRLSGGRAQLFGEVLAAKLSSQAADRIAAAAAHPESGPPLAVLLEAAGEIFAAPQRSWNVLELEALTRAHRDEDIRALESARVHERWANMKTVTEQTRKAGGIDADIDDGAFVHFALALSVGLAMVQPVVDQEPSQESWNALMARIGSAFAPAELALGNEHQNRLPWRLRIDIPDHPGGLALLVRALSTLHAHVVATSVLASGEGTRTIDLAVTVPEKVSADTLLAAAMAAGSNGHVTEGSPDDGLDLPTRVLDGATELVTNPGSAPLSAATLVEADRFEVTSATEGEDDAADVLRLQWTADRHVVLHRDWAPFARAEKTRASALLRLAAALSRMAGDADALGWVAPIKGDETVWIRLARPEDADAVAAMHERCSEQTRYRRYLTGVSEWRDISLSHLAGGHRGATLVVMNQEGAIVSLGNVFPNAPDDSHAAEIALIVEDDYQGRGIGTRLLRHMLELAERIGFREVVAVVLAQNHEMLHVLEATSLDWTRKVEEAVLTMRAPLPVVDAGSLSPAHPPPTRVSSRVQSEGGPAARPPEKKSRNRS
jgi:AcrR family transcriptional regulator/RimJ/RimL family protein N-acetyltransferase